MCVRDVRYQVFISSTFRGLAQARKEVIRAVVDQGHIPVALERFGARDSKDIEVIRKTVTESQIYVIIVGHLYGSIVEGEDIGYTEYEYRIAKEKGLTIIPFAMRSDLVEIKRDNLDRTDQKDRDELDNESRLRKFHDLIKKEHFYIPCDDETNYELQITKVFADLYRDPERLAKIPPGFIKVINSLEKLEQRISDEHVGKKKALADLLWQRYGHRITSHKIGLFLESGSTTAYVADRMKERLSEYVVVEEDGSPSIDIKTNNALVFLQFWLSAQIPCSVFPWGSPDGTFGASYGPVESLVEETPYYPPIALKEDEKGAITQLNKLPFDLRFDREKPRLTISAISGIQLGPNPTIDNATSEDLIDDIGKCRGFHVGSYYNKIFKLFLYQTGLPAIVCAHEDKIDRPIKAGHCHFLYNADDWSNLLKCYPLAFCIGCNVRNVDSVSKRFEALGFSIEKGSSAGVDTAFLARNSVFINEFESLYGPAYSK
jgi:hypothetical protein